MKSAPKRITRRRTTGRPRGDEYDDLPEKNDDEGDESEDADFCQMSEENGCPHNQAEIIADGHLTLPDAKPDLDEILRSQSKPSVTHWDLIPSATNLRAIVSGVVEIRLEYAATSAQQTVHVANFKIPFHTMLVSCRRIKQITVKTLYRHCEPVNARSVSFVVVLRISAR